jgi:Tfp pilus assembly protein PilV
VKRLREASGSALIEIIVALVIFLTVSVGLTSSTINAKRTSDGSRHTAEATTLAFDKLEQMRTEATTSADFTSGSHTDAVTPMNANGASGGIFTRTWTVTTNLTGLSPSVSSGTVGRVDMRVSWPTQTGTASVTLVSYYKLT